MEAITHGAARVVVEEAARVACEAPLREVEQGQDGSKGERTAAAKRPGARACQRALHHDGGAPLLAEAEAPVAAPRAEHPALVAVAGQALRPLDAEGVAVRVVV